MAFLRIGKKEYKMKEMQDLAKVETESVSEVVDAPMTVSVPDIKEDLVREYDRGRELLAKIAELENAVEEAEALKFKYDALLVTLDEYSKRCESLENTIATKNEKIREIKSHRDSIRDELNSYKIKMNNYHLDKEGMKEDIIREYKSRLLETISSQRGSLSKKRVIELIESR